MSPFNRHPDRWIAVPLGLLAAIVAADLAVGPEHSLIALLVVAPLFASLRVGRRSTAAVATLALVAALALGPANGFFGASAHLTRVLAVVAGGALAIWMAHLRGQRERIVLLLAVQGAVSTILNESASFDEASPRILAAIGGTLGWDLGALWCVDEAAGALRRRDRWLADGVRASDFEEASDRTFEPGIGLPGRAWASGRPAAVADVPRQADFPRAAAAARVGLHGGFAFPIGLPGRVVGVIEFYSREEKIPAQPYLEALASVGSQIGQYIERGRVEETVRGNEALKTAVLDSAFDCVITMDSDGRVVEFNPAAERTFGYTRERVVGAEMAELIIPPALRERHRAGLARYLETGEGAIIGKRFEIMGWRADGTEFPVELAITRIRSDGRPLFAGYVRDITEAKRAQRRGALLARATAALNQSLEYEETLAIAARMAVPELADWCAVDTLDEEHVLQRRAVAHVDATQEATLWGLNGPSDDGPADERASVPLKARGEAVGRISFGLTREGARFDADDLALVEQLAGRAASAIENARLYQERSYIARTLQASLLPPRLPEIPGVELAARYHAAGEGNQVGGDFYDIFQTGRSSWAAVIGDVRGKGPDAAALIGLARHTLRAAAMRAAEPDEILATLNEALYREGSDESFCTACYAAIEPGPEGTRVELTSAGHPLPWILRANGQVDTVGHPGTLIGAVPELDVRCEAATLGPGDSLILYTDGVPEARSDEGFFGQERLASLLTGCSGGDAEQLAERLERTVLEFQDNDPRDDVAIVVIRVPLAVLGDSRPPGEAVAPASPS